MAEVLSVCVAFACPSRFMPQQFLMRLTSFSLEANSKRGKICSVLGGTGGKRSKSFLWLSFFCPFSSLSFFHCSCPFSSQWAKGKAMLLFLRMALTFFTPTLKSGVSHVEFSLRYFYRCSGVSLGRSKGGDRLLSAQTQHGVLGQGGMQRHRFDPAIDIPLPCVKQAAPKGRRRQP